jgi:hypothetical protein
VVCNELYGGSEIAKSWDCGIIGTGGGWMIIEDCDERHLLLLLEDGFLETYSRVALYSAKQIPGPES